MHKAIIMKLFYPIQHSSISHGNFLDAFHLHQDIIDVDPSSYEEVAKKKGKENSNSIIMMSRM